MYGIGIVLQAHVVESAASLSPAPAGGTGGTGGTAGGSVREQYLTVVGVLEGSSSQVSRQVQVGDLVLTAAGVPLRGVAAGEVLGLLDGNFGTPVVLGLQRVNAQGLRYVTYVSLDRRSPPTEIRLDPEVRRAGGLGVVGVGGVGGGDVTNIKNGNGYSVGDVKGDNRGDTMGVKADTRGDTGGDAKCSVGLLVRRDGRGNLKVRGSYLCVCMCVFVCL